MCMHSHFHPLLGIDLKWWLHECSTADHVILLWDEDFRERKGREKGVHRPQAGNVKLWTIICWAKYNACQMNWSSTSKNPAAPPPKCYREKVVCEYECVFKHVALSLFLSPSPSLSPSHVHSDTNARPNYHLSNCLKEGEKKGRMGEKKRGITKITYIIRCVYPVMLHWDFYGK